MTAGQPAELPEPIDGVDDELNPHRDPAHDDEPCPCCDGRLLGQLRRSVGARLVLVVCDDPNASVLQTDLDPLTVAAILADLQRQIVVEAGLS